MNETLRARIRRSLERYGTEENVDKRPGVSQLLASIKAALPDLEELAKSCEHTDEDGIYRFYHESFKVYAGLQSSTREIADKLRALAPDPAKPLDSYFEEIVAEGTGKTWKHSHNGAWTKHTRPLVEAYFHARWFLDMAIAFGHEYERPPALMDSGWAAVLSLYGLR